MRPYLRRHSAPDGAEVDTPATRRRQERRQPSMDEGVRADEAGLQPPQPARAAADRGGEPVDQPVDAPVVEVDQRPGQVDAGLLEDRLVERVGVEVAAGGGDQRPGRLLGAGRCRCGTAARPSPAPSTVTTQRQHGDHGVRAGPRSCSPCSPPEDRRSSQSGTEVAIRKPAPTEPTASRISGIGHHRRRLVRVLDVLGPPLRAVEGEHEQPGHVERGQPGAEQRGAAEQPAGPAGAARTRPR